MNENLRELLSKNGQTVTFSKGKHLFNEGDPCKGMLFVFDGSIKVIKISEEGKEALLYRVNKEDLCILSVSCLIGNSDYNAVGVAESDLFGVYIPQPVFLHLLERHADLREFIFRNFSFRIADLIQKLDDHIFKSLKLRLIDYLNSMPEEIHKTHQEIAVELGSSREVISRLLKTLEKEGFIDLSRQFIKKNTPV